MKPPIYFLRVSHLLDACCALPPPSVVSPDLFVCVFSFACVQPVGLRETEISNLDKIIVMGLVEWSLYDDVYWVLACAPCQRQFLPLWPSATHLALQCLEVEALLLQFVLLLLDFLHQQVDASVLSHQHPLQIASLWFYKATKPVTSYYSI